MLVSLGLEWRDSKWRANVIDEDGFPQAISGVESEDLTALSDAFTGQECESVTWVLPYRDLKPGRSEIAKRGAQVSRAFPTATLRLLSQPVAATLHALWLHSSQESSSVPLSTLPLSEGQRVLVCSFGEEDSEVSLVCRGSDELPLIVTAHQSLALSNRAIDDALLSALCRENHLDEAGLSETMRCQWRQNVAGMRRAISRNLGRAVAGRRIFPAKSSLIDEKGTAWEIALSAELYLETVEPFLTAGCDELTAFLQGRSSRPELVVLCGEGAANFGIQNRLIESVLQRLYGEAIASPLSPAPTSSIEMGDAAAGAVLLSARIVAFEEQLPFDVGTWLRVEPDGVLARLLGLPPGASDFWLHPLLARGASLPARFHSADLGVFSVIAPGETLEWEVCWGIPDRVWRHKEAVEFSVTAPTAVTWQIEADTQGVLRTSFENLGGQTAEVREISWFTPSRDPDEVPLLPSLSPAELGTLIQKPPST